MKSSPLIWRSVVNVKLTVKISSIIVAFLENMNFTRIRCLWCAIFVASFTEFKSKTYSLPCVYL